MPEGERAKRGIRTHAGASVHLCRTAIRCMCRASPALGGDCVRLRLYITIFSCVCSITRRRLYQTARVQECLPNMLGRGPTVVRKRRGGRRERESRPWGTRLTTRGPRPRLSRPISRRTGSNSRPSSSGSMRSAPHAGPPLASPPTPPGNLPEHPKRLTQSHETFARSVQAR